MMMMDKVNHLSLPQLPLYFRQHTIVAGDDDVVSDTFPAMRNRKKMEFEIEKKIVPRMPQHYLLIIANGDK